MAKIIDLNVLQKEPLVFNGLDGKDYTIPGNISTNFAIKLASYQEQVENIKSEEEAYQKIKELVVDIFNLDSSKNIDIAYLDEHFDDVRVLKLIVESMMNHVKEIAQDPNFKTPGSTKKK